MSNEGFNGKTLAEKLSKLNNSQQSIESLSRWCISHRKKAKQIVETWDKLFGSQKDQRVSFLYLANDILQNSRRKGSEFVNEFWKVLPSGLKHVYESGDDNGRKVVSRLVEIWEERKVFGSRGQSLKEVTFSKEASSQLVVNVKTSNPIKIMKRDTHSLRLKLAVGAMPEKILTAFHSVYDEFSKEEAALNKCKDAVNHMCKIGADIEIVSAQGNLQGSSLADELQEHELFLQKCVAQLESAEATRASLISQLKSAVEEQESKLEIIQSQLQVARSQIEQVNTMRKKLTLPAIPSHPIGSTNPPEAVRLPSIQLTNTTPQPPLPPPVPFVPVKSTVEESKRAAAAAVAAKLAASTSSAQMLTSVLSSLVAEEAASKNGALKAPNPTLFSPEKRQKLERPTMDVGNSEAGNNIAYFSPQQQPMTNAPSSHGNPIQAPFPPVVPPPPPPQSPTNPPESRFAQSIGLMNGAMSYAYNLPPPPPLPPHIAMGLARPGQQSSSPQQQQQQPATGGYYRPPGNGFYGQMHQPSTPPIHRQ